MSYPPIDVRRGMTTSGATTRPTMSVRSSHRRPRTPVRRRSGVHEPRQPRPRLWLGPQGVGAPGSPGGGFGTEASRGQPSSHALRRREFSQGPYRSAAAVPTPRLRPSRSVGCRSHVTTDEASAAGSRHAPGLLPPAPEVSGGCEGLVPEVGIRRARALEGHQESEVLSGFRRPPCPPAAHDG